MTEPTGEEITVTETFTETVTEQPIGGDSTDTPTDIGSGDGSGAVDAPPADVPPDSGSTVGIPDATPIDVPVAPPVDAPPVDAPPVEDTTAAPIDVPAPTEDVPSADPAPVDAPVDAPADPASDAPVEGTPSMPDAVVPAQVDDSTLGAPAQMGDPHPDVVADASTADNAGSVVGGGNETTDGGDTTGT